MRLSDQTAREDFNRARFRETISRVTNLLNPSAHELVSLREVKEALRPKAETYRGMQTVPISRIVGSEGRYRDFNKSFLPKHEYLRNRWQSVDRAHLEDVILPPIKLYEIGGVYFVRDGNHRVSVAKSQGVMAIDAEIVSLGSEIELDPNLTRDNLMKAVIRYEKERFYQQTNWNKLIPDYDLEFTAPGRYDEVLRHIQGHKYYINQDIEDELPFEHGLMSWHDTVFRPIINVIIEEKVLSRFPRRTPADLYMWMVKHWHELKERYGGEFPVEQAVKDYSSRYGRSIGSQLRALFRAISRPIRTLLSRRDDKP
jgi:hypothetical protein